MCSVQPLDLCNLVFYDASWINRIDPPSHNVSIVKKMIYYLIFLALSKFDIAIRAYIIIQQQYVKFEMCNVHLLGENELLLIFHFRMEVHQFCIQQMIKHIEFNLVQCHHWYIFSIIQRNRINFTQTQCQLDSIEL